MGKSKKKLGKKSGKRLGKKKSKKSKKGKKSKKNLIPPPPPPPPPPDTYFWIRRKMTSIFFEAYEEMPLPDIMEEVAKIIELPSDQFILRFLNGKEIVPTKPGEEKKPGKGGKGKGGKDKGKKSKKKDKKKSKKGKKGSKSSKSSKTLKGKEEKAEPPPPPPIPLLLNEYGINAVSSSAFNPKTVGLCLKLEDGSFEKIDITAWMKPMVIPENVKQFMRAYPPALPNDVAKSVEPPTEDKGDKNKNRRR